MLAGMIIAAERADRSSEFLAGLPPSRTQILLSKAIVLGTACVLTLCVSCGGAALADWLSSPGSADAGCHYPLQDFVPVSLVSIGAAWCASARFENTGPPVGLGFTAPGIVVGGIFLTRFCFGIFDIPDAQSFQTTYSTCFVVIGLVCLIVGSVYFIRRMEP